MSVAELKEEAIRQFAIKVDAIDDEAALNVVLDFLKGIKSGNQDSISLSRHYEKEKNIIDINVSSQDRAIYRKKEGGNEWLDIPELSNQQVLDKNQILELSDIILRIENHYGFPCDIEWAYEQGKFYVVQSRPITTLTN